MAYNASRTTLVNSRSIIKAKISVRDVKAYNKTGSDIADIISYVTKGEKNWRPIKYKVSVDCPSYGLNDCTDKFCVSENWWILIPLNSDH